MTRSPMRRRTGAWERSRAWASVLTVMKSTPRISDSIMRSTALLPPPPTPMTLICAKGSDWGRVVKLSGRSSAPRPDWTRSGNIPFASSSLTLRLYP